MAINPNTMLQDSPWSQGWDAARNRQASATIPVKNTYVVHMLDVEDGFGLSVQQPDSYEHRVLLASSSEEMVKKMLTYLVEKNLET